MEQSIISPGISVALAAFRLSAADPALPDRLMLKAPDKAPPRDPGEWGFRRIWLFRSVKVDPDAGQYLYRFEPCDGANAVREWKLAPWRATGDPDFEALRVSIHSLKVKAAEAWLDMVARFERALVDGTIVVAGRQGSPLAPVTLVPKEAWRHFRICDWEAGYAESVHGEHLYGLQIAPNPSPNNRVNGSKISRRGWKLRQTTEVIEKLHPNDTHRALTDKDLFAVVKREFSITLPNEKPPSMRTVRRAAGRD